MSGRVVAPDAARCGGRPCCTGQKRVQDRFQRLAGTEQRLRTCVRLLSALFLQKMDEACHALHNDRLPASNLMGDLTPGIA